MMYYVEFPYDVIKEYDANIIAGNIYTQVHPCGVILCYP